MKFLLVVCMLLGFMLLAQANEYENLSVSETDSEGEGEEGWGWGSDTDDEEPTPTPKPSYPNNRQLTPCQVANILKDAGFERKDIPLMVCTAKHESSWKCNAVGTNNNGSKDYGLFQINDYWWCSGSTKSKYNGCNMSCQQMLDCELGAKCARQVWREQGKNAWYGYKNHKAECDNYRLPYDCSY